MREIWIRHGLEFMFEKILEDLLPLPKIKVLKHVMFEKLYRLEFGGRLPKQPDADDGDLDSVFD